MQDFLSSDIELAKQKREYLGLKLLSADQYLDVLLKALREYKKPYNAIINGWLTWPEFIILSAHRLGHENVDTKVKEMLGCFASIGSVGGMARASWNKNEYLTWDGWQKL